MSRVVADERVRGSRMRIPRSRGAASGLLVVLLGLWGALIPFVGPAFDFAYDQNQGGAWSAARGWLEVLPGAVAVIGGVLLVRSENRATALLGGWLSVVAGAWFVVGRVVATTLTIGQIGGPVAETDTKAAWLELTYFYGLGAVIVFLGATALGRLSVLSVRDVDYAQKVAARRDTRTDVVDEPTTTLHQPLGEPVPTTRAGAEPLRDETLRDEPLRDEGPVRRSWRHPLGRRRDDPTALRR